MTQGLLPRSYPELFEELKGQIQAAQTRAALAVNRELLRLYWRIGRAISQRQEEEAWGTSVIEHLALDLRRAFPGVDGFSARNLWRMRAFFRASRDLPQPVAETRSQDLPRDPPEDLPQAVADLPWGHHIVLLEKIKNVQERHFYARAASQHGWSRAVLAHQIETRLFHRRGKAVTNFDRVLPPPQSDLAREALKDPYTFDFLTLGHEARERDLERGLVEDVRKLLLELGVGFAFVGQQYHLVVGDEDFYIDLLFYHLKLRCFVVVDLKMRRFTPEDAGKLNFYLSAVDDVLRHPTDQPSMGLVLCKAKNRLVVEYALRDIAKPMGVSAYRLSEHLPESLEGSLPTVADLEAELGDAPEVKAGAPRSPSKATRTRTHRTRGPR